MNTKHIALVALTASLALGATGCPSITQACAKALPVLNETTTIAQDAALALSQAEVYIAQLPPDLRAKAVPILERAREGLRAAAQVSNAAAQACSAPDIATAFAVFVAAWKDLRPFLALFGSAGGAVQPAVQDPIVVGMVSP